MGKLGDFDYFNSVVSAVGVHGEDLVVKGGELALGFFGG